MGDYIAIKSEVEEIETFELEQCSGEEVKVEQIEFDEPEVEFDPDDDFEVGPDPLALDDIPQSSYSREEEFPIPVQKLKYSEIPSRSSSRLNQSNKKAKTTNSEPSENCDSDKTIDEPVCCPILGCNKYLSGQKGLEIHMLKSHRRGFGIDFGTGSRCPIEGCRSIIFFKFKCHLTHHVKLHHRGKTFNWEEIATTLISDLPEVKKPISAEKAERLERRREYNRNRKRLRKQRNGQINSDFDPSAKVTPTYGMITFRFMGRVKVESDDIKQEFEEEDMVFLDLQEPEEVRIEVKSEEIGIDYEDGF